MTASHRLAVVLMNLGGPDTLSAVRPFLKNLFSDPAIMSLPWPVRPVLAEIISRRRSPKLTKICQQMGGGSPLLKNTQQQQRALLELLRERMPKTTVDVFIAMRYWHPLISATVSKVKAFQPDEVILLPLYPQYSSTTTGSSFKEWHRQSKLQRLNVPVREIRSYPENEHFVDAHVSLLEPWIEKATPYGKPRILFSAHGLPQKVVDQGDVYEQEIHQTVESIRKQLPSDLDSVVCYQSKVGPLKWLGPSTEDEIKRAGKDKIPIIVVPISFVSEHSETLVELDKDYLNLSRKEKVPFYGRVSALGDHPIYIKALADLTKRGCS